MMEECIAEAIVNRDEPIPELSFDYNNDDNSSSTTGERSHRRSDASSLRRAIFGHSRQNSQDTTVSHQAESTKAWSLQDRLLTKFVYPGIITS